MNGHSIRDMITTPLGVVEKVEDVIGNGIHIVHDIKNFFPGHNQTNTISAPNQSQTNQTKTNTYKNFEDGIFAIQYPIDWYKGKTSEYYNNLRSYNLVSFYPLAQKHSAHHFEQDFHEFCRAIFYSRSILL
jgi:hypothetical protein